MQTDTRAITKDVEFRLGDIAPGQVLEVLRRITGDFTLEGKIIDIVKMGDPPETYAMMQVTGIDTPMLVPTAALQR